MSLIPGIVTPNKVVIGEELDGDYIELVAGQYRPKAVPTEIIESSAAGATAPPAKPTGDWLHLDTGKGVNPFISGVWDATAGAWVNVSSQIWDKDRNTGITVEQGANDNSIRAYIGGVDGGVTDAAHTSWGFNANTEGEVTACSAFGREANRKNKGVHTSSFGAFSNYENTSDFCAAFGSSSNFQNTAPRVSSFGTLTGYLNAGSDTTACGFQAAFVNLGSGSTLVGSQSGYNNTSKDVSGFGYRSLFKNYGLESTAGGSYSGFRNSGLRGVALGFRALLLNTGPDNVGVGVDSLRQQVGIENTAIGNRTFNNAATAPGVLDPATNTISFTAPHGYGATGTRIGLVVPGAVFTPDVGASDFLLFEVVDANKIKPIDVVMTAPLNMVVTSYLRLNNASAIGYQASPDKSNQIVLGDLRIEELKTAATRVITGVYPQFATDAAATAALPKGQLYHLTGDPVVRQVL